MNTIRCASLVQVDVVSVSIMNLPTPLSVQLVQKDTT